MKSSGGKGIKEKYAISDALHNASKYYDLYVSDGEKKYTKLEVAKIIISSLQYFLGDLND